MINCKVQRGHQVAISGLLSADLNSARALGGNCGKCIHSVRDAATAIRCKLKNLKIVSEYSLCPFYGERECPKNV